MANIFIFCNQSFAQNTVYSAHYNNSNFIKTIDLAKPVGVVGGEFQAGGNGAASYTIPIVVPPGTSGAVPSIAVSYNSQATNGNVGYGWNISGLSAITRVPKNFYNDGQVKGIKYTADDDYSLDGNRLVLQSGVNGTLGAVYATENETYSKIEIINNCGNGPWVFKVTTKSGMVMEYGNDNIATGASVNNIGNWVYWRLYKVIDPRGNYIEYLYDNSDNDSRIKQINYTGNAINGLLPYNKLIFNYTVRLDQNTTYENGLAYNQKYLLDNIIVTGENGLAFKTYRFNYSTDAMFSFLKEVIEVGTNGTELNSTIFKYGEKPLDIVENSHSFLINNGTSGTEKMSGDFDGDGYSDILATNFIYDPNNTGLKFTTDFKVFKRTVSNPLFIQSTPTYPLPGNFEVKEEPYMQNSVIATDFDGDGKDDILTTKMTTTPASNGISITRVVDNVTIYYPNNDATAFAPTAYPTAMVGASNINAFIGSNYISIGDFDGDGRSDYITYLAGAGNGIKIFYTRPTVSNNAEIYDPYGYLTYNSQDFTTADILNSIDFNGDGKTDIMIINDGDCLIFDVVLNIGGTTPYKLNLLYGGGYPTKWHNIFTGDFNGDRKTDLITINNTGVKEISYSNGLSWATSPLIFNTSITMSVPLDYSNLTGHPNDDKILIADYNGDGLMDIANYGHSINNTNKLNLYFSTGNSFYYQQYTSPTNFGLGRPMSVDFNGDGRAEFLNYVTASSPFKILEIKPYGEERFLEKITTGHNGTIELHYDKLTSGEPFYSKGNSGNSTYPLNTIQLPIYNLAAVKTPNGNGGFFQTNYKYEEARLHRAGRGMLGYTRIITEDAVKDIKNESINIFNLTHYVPIPATNKSYLLSTNELLTSKSATHNLVTLAANRFKIELASETSINLKQNVVVTNTFGYDNFGNQNSSTANLNLGLEINTITTNYGAFASAIPNLPISVTAVATRLANPSVTKTTTFNYNNYGELISKIDFDGLPNALTTGFIYDLYGNVIKETLVTAGASSRENEYVWDTKARFIISKSKNCGSCGAGFKQTESYVINPLWGTPTSTTSSDCQTISNIYDGFGRIKHIVMPNGIVSNNILGWDLTNGFVTYLETSQLGQATIKIWHDILSRERKREVDIMFGQKSNILTDYNNSGQISSKTNAHIIGVETPLVTNYTYDAYNRIATESGLTNTISYNYVYDVIASTLTTTKSDLSSKFSSNAVDASGKIIKSQDPGGTVKFLYDSWGNQKNIKQNNITVTTKQYDAYNRLSSIKEINAGLITYTYNGYAEIASQTDASGNIYNFTYDDLGRIILRSGPEGNTSYEYFCKSYDVIINQFGNEVSTESIIDDGGLETENKKPTKKYCCNNNITSIIGFNGILQNFNYDAFNRLISKAETVDAQLYTTNYTYDTYNNLVSTTYPSGLEVINVYDNYSNLLSVEAPGLGATIHTTDAINGMGQLTKYTLGNGFTTNLNYANGFLLQENTSGIQNFSLSWDYTRGLPMQRSDLINGLNEVFTYDNLDRLTSAQVQGQAIQNYYYDLAPLSGMSKGNIKLKDDAGYYRYTANQIHAQSSIANVTNNTNTNLPPLNISINEQNIIYTGFHRVDKISENNMEQKFEYWPSYDRAKSSLYNNGVLAETRYYFGDYEIQNITGGATTEIHYIQAANGITAIITMQAGITEVYYVYKDHLGSFNTITDASGNIVAQQSFDAWGRNRNPTDWTYNNLPTQPTWLYRGFTSHEQIPEFGLINMNARLYDPVVGKMVSPDNFVANPYSSQSYNRYSYANSNPMIYNDPDGNSPLILVPIIAGAVAGAYSAGVMVNNGDYNPFNGGWNDPRTLRWMIGGAIVGGIAGYLGGSIAMAGNSIPGTLWVGAKPLMSGTIGIMVSSSINSVGMHLVTGGNTQIGVSFGFGSVSENGVKGIWNWSELSTMEKIGYTMGALATVQDVVSLFGDQTSVPVRAEHGEGVPHSRVGTSKGTIDISGTHTDGTVYPLDVNGQSIETTWNYIKYWGTHIKKGSYFKGSPAAENWTVNLWNVNGKLLRTMTTNIKKSTDNGLIGIGNFKYGLGFGCQNHSALALTLAGVPTIPIINFHPFILNSQLFLRQVGIYASPIIINQRK
jgi:RHS repeat-associated protein